MTRERSNSQLINLYERMANFSSNTFVDFCVDYDSKLTEIGYTYPQLMMMRLALRKLAHNPYCILAQAQVNDGSWITSIVHTETGVSSILRLTDKNHFSFYMNISDETENGFDGFSKTTETFPLLYLYPNFANTNWQRSYFAKQIHPDYFYGKFAGCSIENRSGNFFIDYIVLKDSEEEVIPTVSVTYKIFPINDFTIFAIDQR